MPVSLNIGAAAQSALMRRLDSVANNIANANTPGFHADGVKFDSLAPRARGHDVAYPFVGADYISERNGPVISTGSPLDFAVRGNGYFSLLSPNGPVYTRDGRMEMTPTGELRSTAGYPLLDASGAPLMVDPNAGPINVSNDGMISQRGRQVGAIGLFALQPQSQLTRYDNSSVTSDKEPQPIVNFMVNGVLQGHIEQSNVDPIREVSKMIEIQRAFDQITASSDMLDSTRLDAIKTLGSSS